VQAPDLAAAQPRGLDAELEGYAWLPRMLDKARATAAGTAGDHQFGCPVDHTCMARLGVTPEVILDLAARCDDAAVLAALRARGIPAAAEAWFDAPAVEAELQEQGTYLRVRRADELAVRDGGCLFAGADHGAGVSVVIVEAAPGDRQPPHTHPTEEVVVVHAGCATFSLGAQQARIVRAGEIVRIPAGIVHTVENTGVGPLRAVAVYAGPAVITTAPG
jgi:quercetin dioxygenase-like cupin family protein